MAQQTADYNQGLRLAFDNANSLIQVARLARDNNKFGVATSLAILSAEESIKAFMCLWKHEYPTVEVPGFKDFFSKHKTKHKHIPHALHYMYKVVDSCSHYLPLVKNIVSLRDDSGQELSEADKEIYLNFAELMRKSVESLPKYDIEGMVKWWNNADNQKQVGLYLDLQGTRWVEPDKINRKMLNSSFEYAEHLLQMVAALKGFHLILPGFGLNVAPNV